MKVCYSRRKFLAVCAGSVTLSGCFGPENQSDDPFGRLRLGANTYYENETWYAEVTVDHEDPRNSEFHNITAIGYSRTGSEVCRAEVGNSTGPASTAISERTTVECSEFPYILAVTADESPCTDGYTFDVIRWNGTEQQRRERLPPGGPIVYDVFELQCDEELPPERLLPDGNETEPSE